MSSPLKNIILPDGTEYYFTATVVVDSTLSSTSENPVQNKAIKSALDTKQDAATAINTSNIGSQSVSYATTAGSATSAINVTNAIKQGEWWTYGTSHNADTVTGEVVFAYNSQTNTATTGTLVGFSNERNTYPFQLQSAYNGDSLFYRRFNGDGNAWGSWCSIIHSGNIASQSVASATSAGDSEKLQGYVSDTANTANTIVRRDAYGYIYATYLNVSNGAQTPTASSYIGYFNSDGFLRKSTLADIRTITDSQLSSASSFQAPGEIYLKSEGSNPTGTKALIWHHSDSGLLIAPQWITSSQNYSIRVNALDNNWTFAPGANMSLNLGSPSYKWWNIYATNGTIQTSDRKNKKDILSIEDSIHVQFFNDLKPVSYKMKDGTSGRTHIGFIAQDVEEAMNKNGLSAIDFAGLCIDERHENKYIYNENGELKDIVEINALDEDGNQIYDYSLRYEEFIALNTMAIQRLQKQVEELERRLA